MIIYNDDRDTPPVEKDDSGYIDAQEQKRLEKKEEDYDYKQIKL